MPVDVWDVRTNQHLFTVNEPDRPNVWGMDRALDDSMLALGGADASGGI